MNKIKLSTIEIGSSPVHAPRAELRWSRNILEQIGCFYSYKSRANENSWFANELTF